MEDTQLPGGYRIIRGIADRPHVQVYVAAAGDGLEVEMARLRTAPGLTEVVERELRTLAGISHPHLQRVEKWGHEGDGLYVVSEHVRGVGLRAELSQVGRLAPTTVARYGADVASALDALHRGELVHGNVRSDTIIRTAEDGSGALPTVVLTGAALGVRDPQELRGPVPSDEASYVAPEFYTDGRLTPQSDIYSLGVVLYELLIGRVPFQGASASAVADQHVHTAPEPVRAFVPNVPASLEYVIMRALEKTPANRFATAAEMAEALDRVVNELAPVVPVVPQSKTTRPWLWVVAVVALVAAALVAAWAFGLFDSKVAVPDVVGRPAAEATATLAAAGLKAGTVTYAGGAVTGIADGAVAKQSPEAGVEVATGSEVDLVLAGQERVTVPAVVGQTRADAESALRAAGFVPGQVTEVPTSNPAPGVVISQNPKGGASAAKGSQVSMSVASARPLSATVPDVRGSTQDAATDELTAAGFRVSATTRVSADVAAGLVIEQTPAAGGQALTDSTVAIVVSSGPSAIPVPDVTTMSQSQATNTLTDAGFRVRVTEQTGGGTPGTVVAQNPAAGATAPPGATVEITVAR